MTKTQQELTKTEVSRRLALAIGYTADRVRVRAEHWRLQPWIEVLNDFARGNSNRIEQDIYGWQRFDHTDPAVIWPIAERFGKFPDRHIGGGFCCYFWSDGKTTATHRVFSFSPVAATASALAIIRHFESKA